MTPKPGHSFVPASTHYKSGITVVYIGQIDYFAPVLGAGRRPDQAPVPLQFISCRTTKTSKITTTTASTTSIGPKRTLSPPQNWIEAMPLTRRARRRGRRKRAAPPASLPLGRPEAVRSSLGTSSLERCPTVASPFLASPPSLPTLSDRLYHLLAHLAIFRLGYDTLLRPYTT